MAGGSAPIGVTARPQPRAGVRGSWRPTLRLAVAVGAVTVLSVMAVVIAEMTAEQLRQVALANSLSNAQAVVSAYLDPVLTRDGLNSGSLPDAQINAQLERLVASSDMERVMIWTATGEVAYSSDPALIGHTEQVDEDMRETLDGASSVAYGDQAEAASLMESLPLLPEPFLELYLPVRGSDGGPAIGIYEMYQDAGPIEASVTATRNAVLVVALGASAALFAILWLAFAGASRRLSAQNRLLQDRSIRDPLTGLFNHSHLVEQLRRRVETSGKPRTAAVALIDVDSFRLLNAGHGHRAGDEVLRRVAAVLTACTPADQLVGRFGPDEFVLLDLRDRRSAESAEHAILDTVELIRAALAEVDVQFAGTERLPLSVSIGVAVAPRDGHRALELLSVAEAAVREAKTGGGAVTRVANQATIASLAAQHTTFGVFEGLVTTVDAKDHYTRHHSEHVTALALFLAEELGLPEEERRLLRLAGLLHDIGKIGVPDAILRKPGPLTPTEELAVQQHVALGEAIVGAVPQLEGVRAAVRHHHERWDGHGYLDHLAGKEIPHLARVLAVADAYSAMTTDRPYRKALTPEKALARMARSAGSQLDPELAMVFVRAMRRRMAESGAEMGFHSAFQPGGVYFE